jgi:4-hydroxy-2-oxoheptanedioate aldolase
VKYKPLKGEKLQRLLTGEEELTDSMKSYIDKFNEGNICIANIESVAAMEKLDEFYLFPDLMLVFIGPHDLSVSLGYPEQWDHPVFEDAVKTIIQTAVKKDFPSGCTFHLSRSVNSLGAGGS